MENQNNTVEDHELEIDYLIEEQKIISLTQFLILSFFSLGLYPAWWAYKAWRFFNQKDRLDILPALRASNNLLFLLPLLTKIQKFAQEKGYSVRYFPIPLFICFILVSLSGFLPYPYQFMSVLGCVFLIQPFKALNYAKKESTHLIVTQQKRLNWRQTMIVILGGIFVVLDFAGNLYHAQASKSQTS
jgi:hypothetical protein